MVDEAWPGTLLGLTDTGEFFSSSDNGTTWTVVSTVPVSDAVAVAAGESNSELYLATRSGLVYRSSNGGSDWTAVGAVPTSNVADMAIRTNGNVFLLTDAGTVWLSEDGGTTFAAIATIAASNYVSLSGDAGGGNMYALTRTGEVARSADFGTTWNTVGTIAMSDAIDIRAAGSTLYVINSSGDVARSLDSGSTWTTIGTVSQVHIVGLTTHEDGLVAVTREGLVATSADASGWTFVGSMDQLTVVAIGNDVPTITAVSDRPAPKPSFVLAPPWPNPLGANALVNVTFEASSPGDFVIELFDVAGRRLPLRATEHVERAGRHAAKWALPNLPSGTYFLRVSSASGGKAMRKIVVVR